MLGEWKRETNNTLGTEFFPHAINIGLRKMTCLSAVDCQSPGRNRKRNKEYQKTKGRKQVVVEIQWPQWIMTFPTVIETICSLHTQLLTNSGLYSWKISNQTVSPTWLTLHCFSTRSPPLLPRRGSHSPLCQWLAELNHLNSQLQALSPSVITHPHPYEGLQSPHQQLLSLPCTGSSNNWQPNWPKGFKAIFSTLLQHCCKLCLYSIPGLAVSGVI